MVIIIIMNIFFYHYLSFFLQNKQELIFEHDFMTDKLRLKPGVSLHLFISTSPCGDGRIFAPNEKACAELVDRNAGRQSRGVLRTKIEGGEGMI